MDNNVVLTLRMEQLDSEDGDGIINTYPAKYRKVGDWHVFSYEETVSSDPGDRTKNLLKIRRSNLDQERYHQFYHGISQ